MSKKIQSRSATSFSVYCLSFLLGGWIAILLPLTSAKAQDENYPPPPLPENIQEYGVPQEFDRRYPDNRRCYRILVSRSNGLNRVRQVVSDAFFYGNAIQAGYGCGEARMRGLTSRLVSNGLRGVRAIEVSNGEIIDDRPYPDRPYPGRRCGYSDKCYYVVVPAISQDLRDLEGRIRGLVRYGEYVEARNEPRGEHVRVGPFEERSQAESLNRYLRNRGNLSNARVYYGK
ncbi:hypothetical protein [Scytonema sp. NUACC26]|uniref:hypothetical protein n=1 Tax=Scytonema sp. NUACC26 TaxID=3140176 RepID=UPI0034DB9E65